MEPLGFGKRLIERVDRRSGDQRHARSGARRVPDGLRRVGRDADAGCRRARRSSTSCRRSSISSGCRSAATWTATPAPICSSGRSPTSVRSPSSRPTTDDVTTRDRSSHRSLARGWRCRSGRRERPEVDFRRLSWVATAHQLGPVGYRDPAGAISPDGQWIAYSEGRFLRVRPVDGGPVVDFPPGEAQIRNIAWSPDNRTILADGNQTQSGWAVVRTGRREREATRGPPPNGLSDLRQLAWSADGQSIAAVVNGEELRILSAAGAISRAQKIGHRIAFPAWTPRRRSRVRRNDRRPVARHDSVRRARRSTPIRTSTYTVRSRSRRTAARCTSRFQTARALSICGRLRRRRSSATADVVRPRHLRTVSGRRRHDRCSESRAIAPSWRLRRVSGGPSRPFATFQSETPSWSPDGRRLGITYGTWRRVIDDAHYPDIAQDAGIIGPMQPARAPSEHRARVGLRRSGALLVAERTLDRVPFAQGSVRRHLAASGRRRHARRGASAFSAAAPKWAGRDGRRTASGFSSTATTERRTGPSAG